MSAAYECCVCFSNDEDYKKHTYCKHPLCIHCFKQVDKCPICRATKGFKKKKINAVADFPQPRIQFVFQLNILSTSLLLESTISRIEIERTPFI